MVLRNSYAVAESLIVNDFSFAKKFDGVAHIRVVGETKNVVIGCSRLLLCYYHVFATFWVAEKCANP